MEKLNTEILKKVNQIETMLRMQREYDEMVFKAHGIESYAEIDDDALNRALLDEIGEYNHELKSDWCWWKNTQKPTDRTKALEEFADIVHFALMKILNECYDRDFPAFDYEKIAWAVAHTWRAGRRAGWGFTFGVAGLIDECDINKIGGGLAILQDCGCFTDDDVFEAYKAKNAVNRRRVLEGY